MVEYTRPKAGEVILAVDAAEARLESLLAPLPVHEQTAVLCLLAGRLSGRAGASVSVVDTLTGLIYAGLLEGREPHLSQGLRSAAARAAQ